MRYVVDEGELRGIAEAMRGAPLLAADTEAAGFHRYFDRACLVQISTRQDTYVVDPLAIASLEALQPVFTDPATEVVFHDADYDLRLLSRDFGITVQRLFDTKIAAQFLGEEAIGLAGLAAKYLGVELEKKFQRADWAQRPLSKEMLEYAAEDTRYLPALRDALHAELRSAGRLHWAEEEFAIQALVRGSAPVEDPEAYLKPRGSRDLAPRELAALRELHRWREDQARERDAAPFRVLSNEALVELARHMPASAAALAEIPGAPRSIVERHSRALLAAVKRARDLPEEDLPVRRRGPPRPRPDPDFEARVERLKGARDAAAEKLRLDRGFLMPRAQLEELAHERPQSLAEMGQMPGIRQWQVEALGEGVLKVLRKKR